MAQPFEQDVILDADGRPIFSAFEYIQKQVDQLQTKIRQIGRDSYKSVEDAGKAIESNVKELQRALAQMRTIATANTGIGGNDFNAALKEREQQLRSQGQLAKVSYREEADARKAAVAQMVEAERAGSQQVARINRERMAAEIESAKNLKAARLEAARAGLVDEAKQINNLQAMSRARADNIDKLQRYRAAARAETDPEQQRALQALITLEKARGTALDTTNRKLEQQATLANRRLSGVDQRQAKALASFDVRDTVNQSGGDIATARLGLQFEQEVARQRVLTASTQEERVAALNALDVANARVAAIRRLAQEEDKVVAAERAQGNRTLTEQQQQRVALAHQYAVELVTTLGGEEAVSRQKMRQVEAEEALANATARTRRELLQNLELENARLRAVEKEAAAQGPQRSPLQNILSPGYAGAAFARTAVYGAAAIAAYGAFNTVTSAVSQTVQMEEELKNLQAISNASDTQLQQLKTSIFQIGQTSKYSVPDLIDIAKVLAQAGVSATDMSNALNSVTKLAQASGSTLEEAGQLVTSAMGAFNLSSDEAGRIADLMTSALNRTKLTVQQTAQAIQYVGATAYEQNISLEQLLATVGAIAQAGVKSGSTIGTGFRQFLIGLQEPTDKLTKQLQLLGLTSNDVNVTVRGLPAVLDTLAKAGFGAGQAYAGLETRAAAFYLVAKNNRDIMDELQLAFANEGAAAIANERAMDSLGAQWKRFSNIMSEAADTETSGFLNGLKIALKTVNDYLDDSNKQLDKVQNRPKPPPSTLDRFNGWLGEKDRQIGGVLFPAAAQLSQAVQMISAYGNAAADATGRSNALETQFNKTSEAVDKQRGLISELDKETLRLTIQKDSLRGNDVRSAAEMVTLMARFEGLGAYILTTGNRYDDLTNAVKRYRAAQLSLLNTDLQAQGAAAEQQVRSARLAGGGIIGSIQHNPADMRLLNAQEQAALQTMRSAQIGSEQFSVAQGVVRGAANRVQNLPGGAALSDQLRNLTIAAGNAATGLARVSSINVQIANNAASNTDVGRKVLDAISDEHGSIPALIAQLGGMQNGSKAKDSVLGQARAQIAETERYINQQLARTDLGLDLRRLLQTSLQAIPGLRQQVTGATAETTAEERARKKKEAADAKAERQAQRDDRSPVITQADIDRIGRAVTGLQLGRGHDESAAARAAEDRLHAEGKTPATGATSGHTRPGGLARDFIQIPASMSDEEARRLAVTLHNAYKNAGIDAFVQYETGKGRNQGTGRHIHVSVARGARRRPGAQGDEEAKDFQYDTQLDQNDLAEAQHELATKLKEAAKATTADTFKAAADAGVAALKKVNDDVMRAALDELANKGVLPGSTEFKTRIAQVQEQQRQNTEDFQNKLAEAIVKTTEAQFKAAILAFEQATSNTDQVAALAESRVKGLDYASLDGRVPDFVKTLASRRSAQAQEAADRSRYDAMAPEIARQQAALSTSQQNLATIPRYDADGTETAAYQTAAQALENLNKQLQDLIDKREALGAALNAGEQLPKTLAEGFNQAAEAYKEANHLSNSFSEDLMNNMTGAIDTVNNSLADMFTNILNGTRTAGQAFGDFAKAIMRYIVQIVAKIIASKIVELLLNVAMAAFGGGTPTDGVIGGASIPAGSIGNATGMFTGGSNRDPTLDRGIPGYAGGGEVMNGSTSRDSVIAKIAKGEWMVRREAVQSVGNKFMAQLNQHGARALQGLAQMPQINFAPKLQSNIWMIRPEDKPTMGPNDVLVTWQQDVLSGGESRKLIQQISRESK